MSKVKNCNNKVSMSQQHVHFTIRSYLFYIITTHMNDKMYHILISGPNISLEKYSLCYRFDNDVVHDKI
jgi:hypothetical protein